MSTLSVDLKRKIANLYVQNRQELDKSNLAAMESFASELVKLIDDEKEKSYASHDLEVLGQSMKHLKDDLERLKSYKPGTDDYDFTFNDCKNLITSTKRWLKMEGLI